MPTHFKVDLTWLHLITTFVGKDRWYVENKGKNMGLFSQLFAMFAKFVGCSWRCKLFYSAGVVNFFTVLAL
jgi:hypothetical protein